MTTMTTVDPYRQFLEALPPRVRFELQETAHLIGWVHAACRDHGWEPAALAAHVTEKRSSLAVTPERVMWRLRRAAGIHDEGDEA